MNVASVNTMTFTVSPGVSGAITHDASNTIFTFTPSSPLAISTVYNGPCNHQQHNLYCSTRDSWDCDPGRNRPDRHVYSIRQSRSGYNVHCYDHHGGPGPFWQRAREGLCMELHDRIAGVSIARTDGVGREFRNSGSLHGY
jgi:hypothetical protein